MSIDNDTDAIIKEAQLDAKREKLLKFFGNHYKTILGFLLFALLCSVIFVVLLFYHDAEQKKYSSILHQALVDEQEGNKSVAESSLKMLYESNSPAGVKSIASIRYAALMLKKDKFDEAVKIYLEVNQNKSCDLYIREFAGYTALKLLVDANNGSYEDKIVKLISQLEKNSKLFKYFVLEQKGIFEWSRGNSDIAGQIFKNLSENPEVAESVKARALEMYKMYNSRNFSQKSGSDKKPDEEPKNKKNDKSK